MKQRIPDEVVKAVMLLLDDTSASCTDEGDECTKCPLHHPVKGCIPARARMFLREDIEEVRRVIEERMEK